MALCIAARSLTPDDRLDHGRRVVTLQTLADAAGLADVVVETGTVDGDGGVVGQSSEEIEVLRGEAPGGERRVHEEHADHAVAVPQRGAHR